MSTTRQASGALWQRIGPLLGLTTLFVGLSFASPYFLTVDNQLNVLRQSSINAILALGQLMVIITAGIDLSIGSVLGVSNECWHCCWSRVGILSPRRGSHRYWRRHRIAEWRPAYKLAPFVHLDAGDDERWPRRGAVARSRCADQRSSRRFPVSNGRPGRRDPMPVVIAGVAYIAAHFFLTRTIWGRHVRHRRQPRGRPARRHPD